jgi:glycosyltransferase involved in cell wall biosynthesis
MTIYFCGIQAMREPDFFSKDINLAWLLRTDARETYRESQRDELEARKEFLMWWFINGRAEYKRNEPATDQQIAVAREVVQTFDELELNRLMRAFYRSRGDVQRHFDLTSPDGRAGFYRWYYVYGVPEAGLFDLVSDEEQEFLAAPVRPVSTLEELPLTRLMSFVWASRPDLQRAVPLATPEDRAKYQAWFYFRGLKESGLHRYLRPKDIVQLYRANPNLGLVDQAPVTWLMWFCWLSDASVRARADLNTGAGRKALQRITHETCQSDGAIRPLFDVMHSRVSEPAGAVAERKSGGDRLVGHLSGNRGVNLVGYALGELGIGEDVRMMARSLEAVGTKFSIINRQPGPDIRQMDFSVAQHLSGKARYPITVVCMTAFDTAQLWLDRRDLFEDTYVIGFWPWELPKWPAEWSVVYELVDEIWCSSRYTFEAFASHSPVPVIQMPMAVTIEGMEKRSRADFGLAEDRFLFLFAFDFMSYPARKNPYGCIKAFREAFPRGDEPVNLVLKISNVVTDSPHWEPIREACSIDPRIVIFDKTLDKGSVLALMNVCDAYVSLHRAEGFGRTLAEAMLLKKPVIATDFSGNIDFISYDTGYSIDCSLVEIQKGDYPCGEGQMWAEPNVSCAAEAMQEAYWNRDKARKKGLAGCGYISSKHSPVTVGQEVMKRLRSLTGWDQKQRSPQVIRGSRAAKRAV